MKLNQAFVRLGLAALLPVLSFSLSSASSTEAEFSASELHELYKSGRYYDCYRASAEAAKENPRAAMPYFYAALALTDSEEDPTMRTKVKNRYGKALNFIETAKTNDPTGRQLGRVFKGLALVQRHLVEKATQSYHAGNPEIRSYFDRIAAVFDQREGTWKNYYHHGRMLVKDEYDFQAWDNPFYRLADTGKDIASLSPDARKIIYLHNLCRMNPPLFRDTYLKQFLGGTLNGKHDVYVSSLIEDLSNANPKLPLYPMPGLIRAADYHAKDLAANKIFQHNSSDGTSFSARLRKLAGDRSFCGENCAAGYDESLSCFMGLLIDRGVTSMGHRHNILADGFKYIGVGVIDPEDQWKIWVFDFSGN